MTVLGITFCVLAILMGGLALIGCFMFLIDDMYGWALGCIVVVLLCLGVIFIDKKKGLVYKNITEIQDILSFDNASEFTLAKKFIKIDIPYEDDDDGNQKKENIEVSYYSIPVKGSKDIQLQDDIQIVRYSDTQKFSPALVCTYKILVKGNFWFNSDTTPVDDAISWYIQIPNSAHIKEVR